MSGVVSIGLRRQRQQLEMLKRVAGSFNADQRRFLVSALKESRLAGQVEVAQICCGAAFDLGREGVCSPLDW